MLEKLTKQQWRLVTKYVQTPEKFKNNAAFYDEALRELERLNFDGRSLSENAAMFRNKLFKVPLCKCGEKVKFNLSSYTWAKTCGQKCYLSTIKQGAKQINAYGKVYESLNDASKELSNIYELLYDSDNKEVFYVNNHDETCLTTLQQHSPLLVDKQWLQTQKDNNVSISELTNTLGVSREVINNAFLYFGISRKHNQLQQETYAILNNEVKFKEEFELNGSEVMASKYNCSPTTILIRARELGCKMGRTISAIESTLKSYIESYNLEVYQSDRSVIGNEIDLYVPTKNLAIELDGLFWHSEWDTTVNKKSLHKKKYELCSSKNITLLRFTDYETTNKLEIVKSMINSKLGVSNKVYARKCVVKEITGTESKKFLTSNHLSGYSVSSVNLGLFYKDELVMCMTFGKPRFNKKYDWELVRMASKLNTTIIGGASKLISYFRTKNKGTILSYSDNRTGSGNTYSKMGFELIGDTEPGYFYVKKNLVYSRFMFQKKTIQKMCNSYDPTKTEFENAVANGYGRYWDCGNKIWVLK